MIQKGTAYGWSVQEKKGHWSWCAYGPEYGVDGSADTEQEAEQKAIKP